jgi:hypothetical protein
LSSSSREITRSAFFVKNSSVLNSFAVTVIFSPPRMIYVLEKSTITSPKTYKFLGLARAARLMSARKRATSSLELNGTVT